MSLMCRQSDTHTNKSTPFYRGFTTKCMFDVIVIDPSRGEKKDNNMEFAFCDIIFGRKDVFKSKLGKKGIEIIIEMASLASIHAHDRLITRFELPK